MKHPFRLGDPDNLTREQAWACVGTNLTLPGLGTLMAGRVTGFLQALLGGVAFLLTTLFGLKFVSWGLQHWAELQNPEGDPVETLTNLWHASRWALLGIGLFGLSWIWAQCSSLGILAQARRQAERNQPPVI